jgi:hypothetical protein
MPLDPSSKAAQAIRSHGEIVPEYLNKLVGDGVRRWARDEQRITDSACRGFGDDLGLRLGVAQVTCGEVGWWR